MKKQYAVPKAEKMEFNYAEVVKASGSDSYRVYIDTTGQACNKTPTDQWWYGMVNYQEGCTKM